MKSENRDKLKNRLLTYPGATPEAVERQIIAYVEREEIGEVLNLLENLVGVHPR